MNEKTKPTAPPVWNAANLASFSRILVTVFFLFFIFRPEVWAKWTAGFLFAWGAFSDYLDGYLARKHNLKSDFGALLDPLADKVLLLSVFVAFVQMDLVPAWMVVVIAAREFLITGLRQVAQSYHVVIAASRAGKHKTVSQIVAASFILAIICVRAAAEKYPESWGWAALQPGGEGDWLHRLVLAGPYWLMLYATAMSVVSGVDYFVKNRHILRGRKA